MVTNTCQVVCPKCMSVNNYEIIDTQLYDTDIHITYSCDSCGTEFIDTYTLVYMGGHSRECEYDRDNITSR
jgi:uncharacterized Zn finger protein